jgi:hypothetical protein
MAAKIILNRAAVAHLLKEAILPDLQRRAANIAAAAGPGFEVDSAIGKNRARASVRTVTFAARRAEATNRTLSRALDAGRR